MKFRVEVVTASGQTDHREVDARTAREAEEQVRKRGLYPIRVIEAAVAKAEKAAKVERDNPLDRIFKISSQDRIQFTQKLSTFLKAGLPILTAIEILRDQAPRGPMKLRLTSISRDIAAGEPLATAVEKFPGDFSPFYIASVRAGETGGQLPEILDRLGDYMNAIYQRKRKAVTASLYPAILVIAVVAVVFLVSIKYIPLVERFLTNLRVELPTLTRIVLDVNTWLRSNIWWFIFVPLIFIAAYRFALSKRPSRLAIHRFWLSSPWIGRLIRLQNFSWIFRTFGMLSYSGVPVLNSFKITGAVVGNEIIKDEIERIRDEVQRGETISKTMEKGQLFDRFSVTMVDVGERSGELDVMMNRVADFYDQELDEFYERMERVAPAAMTLVMAGLVGTVVVALYLPILTIIDTLASNKKGF